MKVTVFIRVFNAESHLRACLEAVFSQQVDFPFEVLILDSGSTDGSPAIYSAFNVRVFQAPSEVFSFASALNFGVSRARGKLFVSLSADAVPEGGAWLANLVRPLFESPELGAVYSRQLPTEECSAPERRDLARKFPQHVEELDMDEFIARVVDGEEPYSVCGFSNVSSCVRREVLEAIPMNDLPRGEDRAFAVECLLGGFAIRYEPASEVRHRHAPSFSRSRKDAEREVFARAYVNSNCLRRLKLPADRPVRFPWYMTLRVPSEIVLVLARSIVAFAIPFRRNRLREVAAHTAKLGELIGFRDGFFTLEKHGHIGALRRADSGSILARASEVQRPQRTKEMTRPDPSAISSDPTTEETEDDSDTAPDDV